MVSGKRGTTSGRVPSLFVCGDMGMEKKRNRPDKDGRHRGEFEKNKKKIYATQTVCGICGKPVNFAVKYPHPLSPCIDHIIPIAKGGHPSDIDNLQLTHWTCNRQKSDKLMDKSIEMPPKQAISNRILPQTMNWSQYRGHTSP
jgi:5-methylcytosine-specific restriction endonuclease McrA